MFQLSEVLNNLWNKKIILLEKDEWKEEVIDFQDPYAYVVKKQDEISFYPVQLIIYFIVLFIVLFIKSV